MARAQVSEGSDDRGKWQDMYSEAFVCGDRRGGYERTAQALMRRRYGQGLRLLLNPFGGCEMDDEQYERLIREALQRTKENPIPGHYEKGPDGREWWVPDSNVTLEERRERFREFAKAMREME